jgi:hypothetical protein
MQMKRNSKRRISYLFNFRQKNYQNFCVFEATGVLLSFVCSELILVILETNKFRIR